MTDFNKTRWSTDGNELHLGMEFSKVDKQRRMVAGWATLDNVDTENDVVTAEASIDAFSRSRRNLREMHKKDSAVGRIVSFKEDEFRAPDGNTYRGIFVKVRVSEGAEDTWKKVLDGTLNGFSIGGAILESEEDFNKDSGTTIRKVTKYDLNELSLVDNPGNQYSDIKNIFKLKKSADGSVTALTGMVEEHKILNVFYCGEDEITAEKPDESYECPICSDEMTVIGYVEDTSNRDEKVSSLVTKYRGGENNMTKANTDESVATGHEAGDPQEVPTPANTETDVNEVEAVETEGIEKVAEVEEVTDESEEIAKRIDSLKTDISDILKKNSLETSNKIEALEKTINATQDFVEEKISSLDEKFSKMNQGLETAKARLSDFEKKLNKVNSSSAFKKSADVDNSAEEIQKSKSTDEDSWGGFFEDPRKDNGAFSVNTLVR